MKHGEWDINCIIALIKPLTFRPSLFDDFVEYELDRLKKLELMEQQQDEDDSNNNIKISPNGEPFNNTLHTTWLWP